MNPSTLQTNINQSFLFFFIFFSATTLVAQSYETIKHQVDQIANYDCQISFDETPGFIIGIIHQDSTYILPYGQLAKNSSETISDSTLFEMGGASKIFTALLCEELRQEELIHFDSTLSDYLGASTNDLSYNPTIKTLLSHQSGYPRLPNNFSAKELDDSNPYGFYTKKDLWKYYLSLQILFSPLEYEYSNTAYGLLEMALEKKTQLPFPALLENKFSKKYHLDDTVIQPRPNQVIAPAYNNFGQQVAHWNSPAFNAAVGIKSSVRDLLKLMQLQLKTDTFDNTHQKVTLTHVDKNSFAALGWHIIAQKKKPDMVLHSGATEGHTVFLGFVKATQTAVVVLSNSKSGANELGYLTLKNLNSNIKRNKKVKKSK